MRRTRLAAAAAVVALATALVPAVATATSTPTTAAAPTEHTGEIEGARFRVVVPDDWNGTLLLFSHGYFPAHFGDFFPDPLPVFLANNPVSEQWFADHGYALAASGFQEGGLGYTLGETVDDQLRVLDWFEDNVGTPEVTVAVGQSMGGNTAVRLAEREPDRIDGVLGLSAAFDPVSIWDSSLDMQVAIRTLLMDPDDPVELVEASDPDASAAALAQAVVEARTTEEGRARLALVASLYNVTGWYGAFEPRPGTLEEWIIGQSHWLHDAYVLGHGPQDRADVEGYLGGNPSTNVGVDYRDLLRRSSERRTVEAAYRAARKAGADVDLRADLRALDEAPRIEADPGARAAMRSHVPQASVRAPVLTLHTTGDGGAPPAEVRSFSEAVRRSGGDVRNLYVERGAHISTSAAEEILAVKALERRIATGHWPSLSPPVLNRRAGAMDPALFAVFDVGGAVSHPMPPAFTRFVPARTPRSSF